MERLGLKNKAKCNTKTFQLGNSALNLILALLHEPGLVFEPTAACGNKQDETSINGRLRQQGVSFLYLRMIWRK